MKKILLITISLCLGLAFSAKAQMANGTYAFLKATNSARVAALGGLPLAVLDGDIQTALFNPSTIGSEMHNRIGISYVDYFADANFGTVQYARSYEKLGNFAATVQFHNYGKFQETSESGLALGTFTGSDFSVNLGWGRRLTPHWSIGANIKYAGLQYESYAAGAIAVDVAGNYLSDNGWIFSLTARNIGLQLFNQFDNHDVRMPFTMDLGASKRLEHLPLTVMFWYDDIQHWNKIYDDPLDLEGYYDPITGEYNEPSKTKQFFTNLGCHLLIGGELAIGKNLFLRASYNYETYRNMSVPERRSLVGFSAGFGVKIKAFQIDYARSRNNIVGSPNFLTLRMDLSKF